MIDNSESEYTIEGSPREMLQRCLKRNQQVIIFEFLDQKKKTLTLRLQDGKNGGSESALE